MSEAAQAVRTQIWSSGGGTQSTAIAVLIIQGILPKPDLSIIVDTERERSTTWAYLERWTLPALREVGVELNRVPKSKYATVDLWGGKAGNTLLIPAYTDKSGEPGKLPNFCSHEWKTRVIQRWATEQGVKSAESWIGYSTDETKRWGRPKATVGKWIKRYPLVQLGMSRADCYRVVEKMGWPQPPHSACWMCPNASEAEWREIKTSGDLPKAAALEAEVRLRDPNAWLHNTMQPIGEVDFDDRQNVMFGGCESGMCFT